MLPTIDISLIGILLAAWNVIRIIWDYTSKAFNWIMQRALALFIGSKFWATAAFLVAAAVLIGIVSTILQRVITMIFNAVIPSSTVNNSITDVIGYFFDSDKLLSVFTFSLSCWISYQVIVSLDFSRRLFQRLYTILSQGWKT